MNDEDDKNNSPDGYGFLYQDPPTRPDTHFNQAEDKRKEREQAEDEKKKAVSAVTKPGGDTRGKQRSDAADEWRIPAVLFAEAIWLDFPDLRTAAVRKRVRRLLPKDGQPSDRALEDEIRPLKPLKR